LGLDLARAATFHHWRVLGSPFAISTAFACNSCSFALMSFLGEVIDPSASYSGFRTGS